MKITYSNKKDILHTNKISSMVNLDIVKNVKITKITFGSVHNIFF